MLEREVIQKLQNSAINELRISLHGLQETHNSLVGKNVFKKVIQNLFLLKDFGISYTLIYVYNNVNRDEIVPLLSLLQEKTILPEGIFIEFVEFS